MLLGSLFFIRLRWRDVKRRLIISDLRCTFSEVVEPTVGFPLQLLRDGAPLY